MNSKRYDKLQAAFEASQPTLPPDFTNRVIQQIENKPAATKRWRWVAAAACLLLLIGIGYTLLPKEQQDEPLVAQQSVRPQTEAPKAEPGPQAEPQEETISPHGTDSQSANDGQRVRKRRTKAKRVQQPQATPETQEQEPAETQEPMPDMMPDPFLVAEMQAQQIRTRGMRLEREIKQQLNIKDRPL